MLSSEKFKGHSQVCQFYELFRYYRRHTKRWEYRVPMGERHFLAFLAKIADIVEIARFSALPSFPKIYIVIT